MKFGVFLLFLTGFGFCASLNILVVFPHPGASHFYVFQPFFRELAKQGHNLTIIGYIPEKKPIANIRDVDLSSNFKHFQEMMDFDLLTGSRMIMYGGAQMLQYFAGVTCEAAVKNENLQQFLKEDNTYDVILAEYFNSNCLNGILKKYKAPVIALSSCVLMPWYNDYFANPDNPSYIPSVFMDYTDKLSFFERVENTIMRTYTNFMFTSAIKTKGYELSRKYLGIDIESGSDILYNTSLMLVNTHYSLNLPRPLVPNIIEVGGMHVPKTTKPLPKNIGKWINESSEGVIYFSLGSMIKGHTFPADKRKEFLKAFGRLPQRVLWKWENETMDEKPNNVMIQKWMPQFDILCHPNVKAFISHGGLLGTTEAVHCGVPVIVMPQFGDQFTNARALEANGGGVILQLKDASEEKIYKSLKTVLSPKFRQQAKELSARFRDRPLPPLETAIYWVEYVARHKGAPHMRTAAVNMPFYKYYLLDVISFLLLLFTLVLYTLFYVLRLCLRRFLLPSDKLKTN